MFRRICFTLGTVAFLAGGSAGIEASPVMAASFAKSSAVTPTGGIDRRVEHPAAAHPGKHSATNAIRTRGLRALIPLVAGSQSSTCTWTFPTSSGSPGSTDNVCVASGNFVLTSTASWDSLTIESGATLTVGDPPNESCGSQRIVLTLTNGGDIQTNGVLDLLSSNNCGGQDSTVAIGSAATLTNEGTIDAALCSTICVAGTRTLQGNVVNMGTVNVTALTVLQGPGTFDNEGAVTISDGKTVTVPAPHPARVSPSPTTPVVRSTVMALRDNSSWRAIITPSTRAPAVRPAILFSWRTMPSSTLAPDRARSRSSSQSLCRATSPADKRWSSHRAHVGTSWPA